MIGAKHRAELAHPRRAALDGALVEFVAKDVYAVGAADVVGAIAIEIGNDHAGARLHEGGRRQLPTQEATILERHPVSVRELEVGNAFSGFRSAPDGFGKARLVKRREALKPGAPRFSYVRWCTVGAKEPRLIVFVEWYEGRKAPRHSRMTGERSMLGARQFEAPPQLHQRGCQRRAANPIERQCRGAPSRHSLGRRDPSRDAHCHRIAVYVAELTVP